jgi:hypothetical protein
MSQLARWRASNLDPSLAQNIYPLGKTIIIAAESSVNAMYDSAAANAWTIKSAGAAVGKTKAEYLNMVRKSRRLPIERTFSALAWQQAQDVAIYRDTKANITGQTNNVPILDYDPQKQVSALARNVPDWPDHLNLSGAGQDAKIGDIQPADEHIGCPVSFDPKLVVRYYEHMVDLIEYHDSWPEFFSDK